LVGRGVVLGSGGFALRSFLWGEGVLEERSFALPEGMRADGRLARRWLRVDEVCMWLTVILESKELEDTEGSTESWRKMSRCHGLARACALPPQASAPPPLPFDVFLSAVTSAAQRTLDALHSRASSSEQPERRSITQAATSRGRSDRRCRGPRHVSGSPAIGRDDACTRCCYQCPPADPRPQNNANRELLLTSLDEAAQVSRTTASSSSTSTSLGPV